MREGVLSRVLRTAEHTPPDNGQMQLTAVYPAHVQPGGAKLQCAMEGDTGLHSGAEWPAGAMRSGLCSNKRLLVLLVPGGRCD